MLSLRAARVVYRYARLVYWLTAESTAGGQRRRRARAQTRGAAVWARPLTELKQTIESMASIAEEAPRPSPAEPCAHCGVGRERMLRCSGCKQTVYCCKEHQVHTDRLLQ